MVEVTPEGTPNPNAVKFTLDRPATDRRNETFRAGSDPEDSPLGARIFALDGVTNVFITSNFVSVNKESDVPWDELLPQVVAAIEEHFG
ncbi:MAG: NifU N-terminal domain-containing protein [Thermoleophilia bacterium]